MTDNEKKNNNNHHHHQNPSYFVFLDASNDLLVACSYKGITNYTKEVRSAKHGIYKNRDSERNQTNSA